MATNPKLLKARELFHVKLREIVESRKLSASALAAQIPGINRRVVAHWIHEDPKEQQVPTGIYMCWLLQALELDPEELVGPIPGSEGGKMGRNRRQERRSRSGAPLDTDLLIALLERLLGELRGDPGRKPEGNARKAGGTSA